MLTKREIGLVVVVVLVVIVVGSGIGVDSWHKVRPVPVPPKSAVVSAGAAAATKQAFCSSSGCANGKILNRLTGKLDSLVGHDGHIPNRLTGI